MLTAVLVSTHGNLRPQWVQTLLELQGRDRVYWEWKYPIHISRNVLTEAALRDGHEWLFYLDDDVLLSPTALTILHRAAETNNAKFVSGIYHNVFEVGGQAKICAVLGAHDPTTGFKPAPAPLEPRHFDVVGLGCALVHRSIFDGLTAPWFEWAKKGPGEDVSFCLKVAKERGVRPLVVPSVRAGHLKLGVFAPDGKWRVIS